MSERAYNFGLGELFDRLSILQLKEIFITDHRKEYEEEIKLIIHDLNLIIKEEKPQFTAELIRCIIILSQYNLHIWHNESEARKGNKEKADLFKTHALNGIRCSAKNKIQESVGGRKDFKIDCIAAEYSQYEPSW